MCGQIDFFNEVYKLKTKGVSFVVGKDLNRKKGNQFYLDIFTEIFLQKSSIVNSQPMGRASLIHKT